MLPDSRRIYPQGELAGQVIGTVGIDNQGLTGLEASEDELLHGTDGERQVDPRRARRRARAQHGRRGDQPARDLKLTIDAQPPGRDRATSSPGSARPTSPDGATAIVMDPQQLARSSRWPTGPSFDPSDPGNADPERARQHGHGLHLRAGLDLQGLHGRRSARAGTGDARDDVRRSRRRSRSPTARSRTPTTRLRHASRSPTSSSTRPTSARSRSGWSSAPTDFDHWIHRFGFGAPTGIQFPGEEQGIVIPVDDYSGSTMGNLPIGQGLSVTPMQMAAAYSAIADGGVLHTPRLVLSEDGEQVPEDRGQAGDQQQGRLGSSATMLEGVLAPGGTAAGGQRPRLHARRQDRHGAEGRSQTAPTRTPSSSPRSSASPRPQDPRLLVGGRRRQPEGRLLRRHGRGARVRRDREVRAAVPADPASSSRRRRLREGS